MRRSQLEQLRRQLTEAVDRGVHVEDAAKVLGVPRASAYRWVALRRAGGQAALAPKTADRSGTRMLTADQERELAAVIGETDPRDHGYDAALWTRAIIAELVAELVAERFGVRYTPRGIGNVLHRLGLSVQRPIVRAAEADPARQNAWTEQDYPAIAQQAAEQQATVVFLDEAGVRSDYHSGTTWAPVGKTPVVKGTGKRHSVNMISAVTAAGAL